MFGKKLRLSLPVFLLGCVLLVPCYGDPLEITEAELMELETILERQSIIIETQSIIIERQAKSLDGLQTIIEQQQNVIKAQESSINALKISFNEYEATTKVTVLKRAAISVSIGFSLVGLAILIFK